MVNLFKNQTNQRFDIGIGNGKLAAVSSFLLGGKGVYANDSPANLDKLYPKNRPKRIRSGDSSVSTSTSNNLSPNVLDTASSKSPSKSRSKKNSTEKRKKSLSSPSGYSPAQFKSRQEKEELVEAAGVQLFRSRPSSPSPR